MGSSTQCSAPLLLVPADPLQSLAEHPRASTSRARPGGRLGQVLSSAGAPGLDQGERSIAQDAGRRGRCHPDQVDTLHFRRKGQHKASPHQPH